MPSPDSPELRLLAQLAGIAPSRMAAAFNDPERFLDHVTLEDAIRFKEACDRFAAVQALMIARLAIAASSLEEAMRQATRTVAREVK